MFYADLDSGGTHRSEGDDNAASDVGMGGLGGLHTLNGAWAAAWGADAPPTLAECAAQPASAWSEDMMSVWKAWTAAADKLYAGLDSKPGWCVRTNGGRFAYMHLTDGRPWAFIVWRTTSDG
ncbi:MAG: hypothetical protein HOV83_08270 [Catenulispora sp.]|nr:hypothetical protein [Catenulispora sp.]